MAKLRVEPSPSNADKPGRAVACALAPPTVTLCPTPSFAEPAGEPDILSSSPTLGPACLSFRHHLS